MMIHPKVAIGYLNGNEFKGLRINKSPFFMVSDTSVLDEMFSKIGNVKKWVEDNSESQYHDVYSVIKNETVDGDNIVAQVEHHKYVADDKMHEDGIIILYALPVDKDLCNVTDCKVITIVTTERMGKINSIRERPNV